MWMQTTQLKPVFPDVSVTLLNSELTTFQLMQFFFKSLSNILFATTPQQVPHQ